MTQTTDTWPVVLVAQRLETEKHTDIALRAWQRSELAQSGWEIHLAGGGAQEGVLRSLAQDLAVTDSVRATAGVPPAGPACGCAAEGPQSVDQGAELGLRIKSGTPAGSTSCRTKVRKSDYPIFGTSARL